MQLASRDGIVCDQCSATYKKDFTYYSFDYRAVTVIAGRKQALREILNSPVIFSLDICQQCFDQIKKDVVRHYQKAMTSDVKKRGQHQILVCEMCGSRFTANDYEYYLCNVTEVNVMMSGQPNICSTCQNQTYDNDKICSKCNGTNFTRLANTNVCDRLLEINMCEDSYKNMVNKAELVRRTSSEWSTES